MAEAKFVEIVRFYEDGGPVDRAVAPSHYDMCTWEPFFDIPGWVVEEVLGSPRFHAFKI